MTTRTALYAAGLLLGLAVLAAPARAQASIYAGGCSGLGPVPDISHSGTLAPGAPNTIHLTGAAPGGLVLLFLGSINTDPEGNVLDIPLDNVDGVNPGCSLHTTADFLFLDTADANGEYDFTFPLKTGLGPDLNFQFAVWESTSPVSIVLSPALHLHVPLVLTPDAASLDLGSQQMGTSTAPTVLTLTNDTALVVKLTDVVVFDESASDFSISLAGPPPIKLLPGESTPVEVTFTPGGTGVRTAQLQVLQQWLPGNFEPTVVAVQGIGYGPPGAEYLVDCGSASDYVDGGFQVWNADFGYSTGTERFSNAPITGTADSPLYQYFRTGGSGFDYALVAPDGDYEVTLHFAETLKNAAGQRVFDVLAEGALVLDDLDVFAQAGGKDIAWQTTVPVTVADGQLDLSFVPVTSLPIVSAIEARSVFPVLEVTPPAIDFGPVAQGDSVDVPATVANTGTAPMDITSIAFQIHGGVGHDFYLDLDGQQYVGDEKDVVFPVSIALAPGASLPATFSFVPSEHSDNDVDVVFSGNFDPVAVNLLGDGGSQGSAFLHVVIQPIGTVVDYDGNGSEPVTLDGTFSHTHEEGQEIVGFTWTEGGNVLSTAALASVPFPVGDHEVCLEIADDKVPPETLSQCIDFSVHPVSAVPGVLADYFATGATPPENLLDAPPLQPDWTETLPTFTVSNQDGVGGSGLSDNVLVRLTGDLTVGTADTYAFSLLGGVDDRLFVDGMSYGGPLMLAAGQHAIEARFAVADLGDLPLIVSAAVGGGGSLPLDPADVAHDETLLPPTLNSLPAQGSTLGGDLITLGGYGFFPSDAVTVHWGADDLVLADFTALDAASISFLSPPHSAGTIAVSVETPNGLSNVLTYEYSESAPPPVAFTLFSDVATITRPTCAAWGPDGRLYVGMRQGRITALTFDDDYNVIASDLYTGVLGQTNSDLLGLTFNPYDPPSPVKLYIAHSELYAQGGDPPTQPAPYPGQVSVLTGPDFDSPVPLITGLPTSNHDHAVNGLAFDNNGDLLICLGGNTNAGVPGDLIGGLPESPLTGALLKAATSKAGFNGAITYVETDSGLPNDDQRDGDIVDVAPGTDVSVLAPGLRNSFDLAYTTRKMLYATDNGPNTGYGVISTGPDTEGGEAASADELLLVESGVYYGHPNRNRGRTDPRQNVYHYILGPSIPETFRQNIDVLSSSTDGIDEYRASTFGGQMRGDLLAQRWNGELYRVVLADDGRSVVSTLTVGPTPAGLGVVTGPGGAIVGLDYTDSQVHVLVPDDPSAVGVTAFDITPWRAPATGGTPFVIGGENFADLASTSVTIGGLPATLTSVTPKRITGLVPAHPAPTTDMVDVVVTSGPEQSTLTAAFRYLFVPAGNEPGDWRTVEPMPAAIGEVAGGILDGELYLVGEDDASTLRYDLYTDNWAPAGTLAARPFPGGHHAAEVFDGKLYLLGGVMGGSAGKVQIYDPATDTWNTGTNVPWAAGSSASALIDGRIYLAGGFVNGSFTVDDTAVYDPQADSWTALAPMPEPRNHAAAATDGSRLWVFGGRGPGSGDANVVANGYADVQVYDPVTDTWDSSSLPGSSLQPLPIGRGGMGKAVYWQGEFYVFGGETLDGPGAEPGNVYDRVDVYDPQTNTWRTEADMPTARHGIFPLLFESRILVCGGGVTSGDSSSPICEVFTRQ